MRDRLGQVRAEGKKLPRCVVVDDPDAPDYGRIYFTRPHVEAAEGAMCKLLVVHGLDWEAMQLDSARNPFSWNRRELRHRAGKVLDKRLRTPRALLFRHEASHLPRLRALRGEMLAASAEQRRYLEFAQARIADLDRRLAGDGDGGVAAARTLQLQQAREMLPAAVAAGVADVRPLLLQPPEAPSELHVPAPSTLLGTDQALVAGRESGEAGHSGAGGEDLVQQARRRGVPSFLLAAQPVR